MTDTLVLKNTKFTKGLVMPKKGTYLELDREEMEYVDGGWVLSAIGAGLQVASLGCNILLLLNTVGILHFDSNTLFWLKVSADVLGIAGTLCGIAGALRGLSTSVMKNVAAHVASKAALRKEYVMAVINGIIFCANSGVSLTSTIISRFN